MVYSNESFTWNGGGQQAYNREHTWPQSYGFADSVFGENNAARTDTHHLMLSNVDYNSLRGNLWFDNCTGGSCSNAGLTTVANHGVGGGAGHGDSNWKDSDKFEPWDFRKGDIARAMFYMDVRYSGDVANEADLELTDNTALIGTGNRFMGKLSTLGEWHIADPVDAIDQQRNEVVFSFQNNRNPFIDHPEWVEKVFTVCQSAGPADLIFANSFD
jgi:endonuclease I